MTDTEKNLFLNGGYRSFELPPLPFMAAGDPANMQQAWNISYWLKDLVARGDEEAHKAVVDHYQLDQYPGAIAELSSERPDLGIPNFDIENPSEGATPRELLLGAAAVFGWAE